MNKSKAVEGYLGWQYMRKERAESLDALAFECEQILNDNDVSLDVVAVSEPGRGKDGDLPVINIVICGRHEAYVLIDKFREQGIEFEGPKTVTGDEIIDRYSHKGKLFIDFIPSDGVKA